MKESQSNIEILLSEVHSCARDPIQDFINSLDDWSPYIPPEFQHNEIFEITPYIAQRTLLNGTLNISLRIHQMIGEEKATAGMLTISTYEKDESVVVESLYIKSPNNGFTRWQQFTSEGKGASTTLEKRQVAYEKPENGDVHSDEEMAEIVENILEIMKDMKREYSGLSKEDILKSI
jgi:hypothetical protein